MTCPILPTPTVSAMTDHFEFDPTLPKSVQIADEVERRIKTGEYGTNHPIYEVRIIQEFGVAKVTARKATTLLRERGLIRTISGMGSYVNPPEKWGDQEARN